MTVRHLNILRPDQWQISAPMRTPRTMNPFLLAMFRVRGEVPNKDQVYDTGQLVGVEYTSGAVTDRC
jgi:hypothetical protein